MPRQARQLTTDQRAAAFIQRYLESGNRHEAAKAAVPAGIPANVASTMMARADVQAAIAEHEAGRIYGIALPLAVNTLISIMTRANGPAGARVMAAKIVLDRTLGDKSVSAGALSPSEMTSDQLAAAIDQLETIAAQRAVPVVQAPAPVVDVDPFD